MIRSLLPVKQILVIAAIIFGLSGFNRAATITSTGTGGNWNNVSSWVGGVVPGAGDDVIIVSTAVITVTADANARTLDIFGTIILNDSFTLTVQGDVTVESSGFLYLSGNTSCTGSAISTLIIYGSYNNYGYTCFWKGWVVIAGDLYSPSASGIQNNGYLIIGGNAIGIIIQTGGNSVYPINPNATISLSGTTPIITPPVSPPALVTIINDVIYGGSCSFTITGPQNVTSCNNGPATFLISSTTATSPTYQWEENNGTGWISLNNIGVYSGVTTSSLAISNTAGMNGNIYRCKVTNASSCSKYSYAATLIVSSSFPVGSVGTITGVTGQCPGLANQTYSIAPVSDATSYTWIVPTGWTITGGAGTPVIIVTTGSPGQNGNISVTASNDCSSNLNSLAVTVSGIPPAAGSITGSATVCLGATGVIYSIPAIASASNYIWTLPSGATITAGSNTNNITVSYSLAAVSGNVSVYGTNACGSGASSPVFPVTVTPLNTIALISGAGTDAQTSCINNTISNITYSTTGATGANVTGLPSGVTGSWAANILTISGIPTVSGTFNYTVTLTGGCGVITAGGNLTVLPINTLTLTSGAGTNLQTGCINNAITNITYSTTGASGATFTGLPAGITGSWTANVVTISGVPTVSGTFNYTVTLTGGCGTISSGGTITVTPDNNVTLTSGIGTDSQIRCINSPISNITYATTGAAGAIVTGLPSGVTSTWAANVLTISGTPTISGIFNYTVSLAGGCGAISTNGSITVPSNNTMVLTSGAGTNNQTRCINTAISNITYSTTGATGATVTGLPAGITGNWSANIVTISGIPTVSGTYNYAVTLTGGCGVITSGGTINVTPNNSVILTSAAGTDNQTRCIYTAITNITYLTTGATGATITGLPAGVTGTWASNNVTIIGNPTISGVFNYTVNLTGGCGLITTNGTITVTPNNIISLSSGAGTNNQTRCINSAIIAITYSTTGATGATITGLPPGVNGSWAANVVTISGTPTMSGTFSYTVTLTGGCGVTTSTGSITVSPVNSVTLTSATGTDNQSKCVNTSINNISYSTVGATGATVTGLPAGVSASWAANVVTISGTPSATGSFNYTVTLTGGCGTITTTGIITVTPNNSITLTSGAGTNNQTRCINSALTNITYSTTGATGATITGLPAGVTGSWTANVVTLSGTPSVSGSFNYTVALTGGCGVTTSTGTITVTPVNSVILTSAAGTDNQTKCINTSITNITYATSGSTGATVTGLPSGVTGTWTSNVVTIAGIPTISGTFIYTVTLTGGCGNTQVNGTISVNQTKPVSVSISADSNPLCSGKTITLTTVTTNGGNAPSYQWEVNGANVGGNTKTYSYIPVNNDIVIVILTSNEACISGNPATSIPLTIGVNSLPPAPIVKVLTQPSCGLPTGSISLENLPSGNWTINPGKVTGSSASTTLSGLNPGTYSYTVTDANGCISPASSDIVIAIPGNTISGSLSNQKNVTCHGGNAGSITVTGSGGQAPYQYKVGSSAFQNSGTFSSLVAGTYVITVQDAKLCTSTVQAVITEPDQIKMNYNTTDASCPNMEDGSVSLEIAGGNQPYTVLWSDGNTLTKRQNIKGGDYNVKITDVNGCEETFEVKVGNSAAGKCLEIQEIITPNNDGHYDTWKIKNIEMYPDAEVHVYNRWGKEVFSTKNISANEWDGTINGVALPTDSYRYVLYLTKDLKPLTGTVTIIR